MNLQDDLGNLMIDDVQIAVNNGFYCLSDYLDLLESRGVEVNMYIVVRSKRFIACMREFFGIDMENVSKPIAVLKNEGLFFTKAGRSYCDKRLFIVFYVLCSNFGLFDCISKGFGLGRNE